MPRLGRFAWCLTFVLGCAAARGPGAQLVDTANEFNLATRFGRMDMALEQTKPSFREHFLESRQAWGAEIRIVDVNVAGIRMHQDRADVLVQVAWTRMSEATLKATTLSQSWDHAESGGWLLSRERRVEGDPGLLGEPLPLVVTGPPRDVQFETKSLGTLD